MNSDNHIGTMTIKGAKYFFFWPQQTVEQRIAAAKEERLKCCSETRLFDCIIENVWEYTKDSLEEWDLGEQGAGKEAK